MTPPHNPNARPRRRRLTDQWRSRYLLALVPVVLGGFVLAAAATTRHLLSGLAWFAVLAAGGALSALAARYKAGSHPQSNADDQPETMINTRAMSVVGTVLVTALTGCTAFTLVRGESTGPYTALLAISGISYVIALVALRTQAS